MKTAIRVYWGSCEPEWYLYIDGKYHRYWGEYHDGPLPSEWTIVYESKL